MLACVLLICCCACGKTATTTEPATTTAAPTTVLNVNLGGTEVPEDVRELELGPQDFTYESLMLSLPRLRKLERLSFTDEVELTTEQFEAIRGATKAEINYGVEIAGTVYSPRTRELSLTGLTSETLPAYLEPLSRLRHLETLHLNGEEDALLLGAEDLDFLRQTFPELTLDYTVEIGGVRYEPAAEKVDLSMLSGEELPAALESMRLLPELSKITLMDAEDTTRLSMSDAKLVLDAFPEAKIYYKFELFGKTLCTLDERVEYDSVTLTDADEPAIRAALDLLPKCTYFKLDEDHYGISNEIMASIRDDYPNTKVVWRVWVHYLNMLTDEEILRISHVVTDENCGPLKYCTGAVYVDLGHNEQGQLTDTSYLAYMPNLECLILSGASITDLSPLVNCQKLTWLELGYCGTITDLSPLSQIPDLKYLNISGEFQIRDLSALDNVKLERFMAAECRIPYAEQKRFEEVHPDCLVGWSGFLYGYPWRYNEGANALYNAFDYYNEMRTLFCYYDGDTYWGNTKNSPYGDGYIALRDPEFAASRET